MLRRQPTLSFRCDTEGGAEGGEEGQRAFLARVNPITQDHPSRIPSFPSHSPAQVINVKKIQARGDKGDRYRLVLSDGEFYTQALVASQVRRWWHRARCYYYYFFLSFLSPPPFSSFCLCYG